MACNNQLCDDNYFFNVNNLQWNKQIIILSFQKIVSTFQLVVFDSLPVDHGAPLFQMKLCF